VIWTYANFGRLFAIAVTNLMLSGDNTLAVGLVVRKLSAARRKIALCAGITTATAMQALATSAAASVLKFPAVALAAGIMLVAIAIRLLRNDFSNDPEPSAEGDDSLLQSIAMVTGAYLLTSLDNIVAIASLGANDPPILYLGLFLSCLLLIFCGMLVASLMRSYPIIVTAVAGLLGWKAGMIMVGALGHFIAMPNSRLFAFLLSALTALLVVSSPAWWRSGHLEGKPAEQL
jgi:YjbE family integral membrane protein